MKVETKKVEELVHEISIEVDADFVNEKLNNRFAEVRKDVKIDGFRKGKTPMNRIKVLFGGDVKAETIDKVIKATFHKVIEDSGLKVATTPIVSDVDYTDEGSIKYKIRVEVYPEIEDVDTDDLKLTTVEYEVTDEEVDYGVYELRQPRAELRKVDRPVREGDLVTVDIKKVYDPKMAIDGDNFPNSLVDLSNPLTMKEFKAQIPGMKSGDEKEIEVNYKENYPDKKLAGEHVRFQVTVSNTQEQTLPEFDDAFAKSTGIAETSLDLRMKIMENITQKKVQDIKSHQKSEIISQICRKNQIPIPKGLINKYIDAKIEDMKKENPDLDIDRDKIYNDNYELTVNTYRWTFLVNHIVSKENIEVLPSETENVIKGFAEKYKTTKENVLSVFRKNGTLDSINNLLLEDKVIDLLQNKAEFVNIEPMENNKDS